MSVLEIKKTYPPSPLSDSVKINISDTTPESVHGSLDKSLSGNLDDYNISKLEPETLANDGRLIIKAELESKKSYRDRYRTAAKAMVTLEERLLMVEETLQTLLKEKEYTNSVVQTLQDEKEYTKSIMLRSQIYTQLLSILQDQLFDSLPYYLQQDLRKAGLANLPHTFALWWKVWNDRDPKVFPLPSSISQAHYTYDSGLSAFVHLLFNRHGGESRIGISVRKAWESLNPEARDLMVYCWCTKKSENVARNAMVHPVVTKMQAEQLLSRDLCRGLQHLHPCAMKYVQVSTSFKT